MKGIKINMEMVNCGLLLVILILVIVCYVRKNETFEDPARAAEGTDHGGTPEEQDEEPGDEHPEEQDAEVAPAAGEESASRDWREGRNGVPAPEEGPPPPPPVREDNNNYNPNNGMENNNNNNYYWHRHIQHNVNHNSQ